MVRQIARIYDTAIATTCPNCKTCLMFFRNRNPQIDSCGFESYSFRCNGCASYLGGIIDPMNEQLLVSLSEPMGWCEQEKWITKRSPLLAAPRSPF
jgi:hypothetical protein